MKGYSLCASAHWPDALVRRRRPMRSFALLLSAVLLAFGPGRAGVEQSTHAAEIASPTAMARAVTDLGTLGGDDSEAGAINQAGRVLGWSNTGAGDDHAFLWDGNGMTDLGNLGGDDSDAHDINETGQVVGWADMDSGGFHAVVWEGGKATDLGTLGGDESEALDI